jgi:uncharacterized membrane protein YkoI
LGVGMLLSVIFIFSPLVSTKAQLQFQNQQGETNATILNQYKKEPTIDGSVSLTNNIVNFIKENTKIPFIDDAETAQQQIVNGTVLGGHLGVSQGYLTYTYLVANPSDNTIHKIIIDGGNGQVLSTTEGTSLESLFGQSRHAGFGHWKGHHGIFEELWNSPPFRSAYWIPFGSNGNEGGIGTW